MTDYQLLKGVDIFIQFPTYGANVDIRSTKDGFLPLAVATKAPI